jgi:hypothetical protein
MKVQQIILLACLTGFACDVPNVQRLRVSQRSPSSTIKTSESAPTVTQSIRAETYTTICAIEGNDCGNGAERECCGGLWCSGELNAYGPSSCVPGQEVGNFCTDNNQCASGRCSSHICRPSECFEQEEECDGGDLPCCQGFICERDTLAYGIARCVPPFEDGEFCMDNAQCASGLCEENECRTEQCQALGQHCYDTKCCDGLVCTLDPNSYGIGRCDLPFDNGAFCIDNGQCASQICTHNVCSP